MSLDAKSCSTTLTVASSMKRSWLYVSISAVNSGSPAVTISTPAYFMGSRTIYDSARGFYCRMVAHGLAPELAPLSCSCSAATISFKMSSRFRVISQPGKCNFSLRKSLM